MATLAQMKGPFLLKQLMLRLTMNTLRAMSILSLFLTLRTSARSRAEFQLEVLA